MQNDSYDFLDKSYLKYKKENKGYRIFDEIEKIKLRYRNYYFAIDEYSNIYGINFGVSSAELIKGGKSKELSYGYIHYSSDCIIKGLRGTKYEDQPYDYCEWHTCHSRIVLKVLSDLKSPVEYCDEDERKQYLKYIKK